jgi:Zn finger protein HypA/HybF involved in hydrogenase expression
MHCKQNNATSTSKITIQIGEFSGVEPKLLLIAFDAFKEQSECAKDALLEILETKNSSEMLLLRLELQ